MPFTQAFDQFFTIVVVLGITIYLLRSVLGVALLIAGALPSRLGASARAAGQRVTPRLVMKIITTFTGLLVAATGVGASTALATPESASSTSASSQPGDAEYYDFDDLEDLIAIDRGPSGEYDIPAIDAEETTTTEAKTNTNSQRQTEGNNSSKPQAGTQTSTTTSKHKANKQQTGKATKPGVATTNDRQSQTKRSTVIVREGDTLWSIAAQQLGSQASDAKIDREWRRWYRANAEVVGSDPDIIVPGMKLEAPQS